MFWSGNYIVVRELNFLLKEENVTLTQILEADDILQECKADNKALIQFLTKPEILAELITLITEEPPKDVELSSQYRHASLACEVLTSHLSMLSDRLSSDATQMNRLCDFINREPPLNPLLASYFSKTVEMLLERSPKQDWYLYHIVCLRVLDFFKSRRDFLPNLLRHIATSAVADTFKYFICLDELFNKVVMEWLEEHQFLESLIQIICGTYSPEELTPTLGAPAPGAAVPGPPAPGTPAPGEEKAAAETQGEKKGEGERKEEGELNHKDEEHKVKEQAPSPPPAAPCPPPPAPPADADDTLAARMCAVASANAAALLCDIIINGCATDQGQIRPRTGSVLMSRLQSESLVRLLLQSMFTSPPAARRHAIVNGSRVVQALTSRDPILPGSAYLNEDGVREGSAEAGGSGAGRGAVELAVAPHLPLLHQALLQHPEECSTQEPPAASSAQSGDTPPAQARRTRAVGAARVEVATLLAQLAVSEVQEVPTTMLTLGTPGVLLDMFLQYPDNNFLHAAVYNLVKAALNNQPYRTQYARHLIVECDILTRLMDVFEENESKKSPAARSGYMGHVVLMLRRLQTALEPPPGHDLGHSLALPSELLARWNEFTCERLAPLLQRHDTPLGGYYPSDNIYEFSDMATAGLDELADDLNVDDANEVLGGAGAADFLADGLTDDDNNFQFAATRNSFLELASKKFNDYTWDDGPEGEGEGEGETETERECGGEPRERAGREHFAVDSTVRDLVHDPLSEPSPWESANDDSNQSGEGWAQFGSDAFGNPVDPFGGSGVGGGGGVGGGSGVAGQDAFWSYSWSNSGEGPDPSSVSGSGALEASLQNMQLQCERELQREHDARSVELANNLLTAMSAMTPDVIANIVNANMPGPAPSEHAAEHAEHPAEHAADSDDTNER